MTTGVEVQDAPSRRAPDEIVEPERIDDRPLPRRLMAPLATAGVVLIGCAYLFAVDPNEPGHYPLCPTRALLGIDCPGCGAMRGTHALLHGDIPGMLDHNILLAAFIPIAVVMWARWLVRSVRGRRPAVTYRQARGHTRISVVILILVLVFGVVRNFVPYLGSGT
jgi:hypothetical protein